MSRELWSSSKNFFFIRIPSEYFENLLRLVDPAVNKKNTNFKNVIVTERLATELGFSAWCTCLKFQRSQYR